MLFSLACSATFRAKIAPKIRPNPQLKRLTKTVKSVTNAAAFAVELQLFTAVEINLLTGLDNAKTCPKTSINII